ncbi:unnamed protein product, partial [Symbiodinium microadriaticum]
MENKEIRAHCGTWEPVPDSGNIDRVFVARPTIGNALKAMKDRHFKLGAGVGEMTELGKRHVQRAASVVKQHLLQNCVENGALAHAFDIMSVVPEEYKSGKWTEERREFGRRTGELLRNYDFSASMDFGAFDGSCTKGMRDLIENDIILSLFSKILGTENQDGLLYAAIKDRIKDKCHMGVKNIVKAIIFDMIRESGDRGTLV